MNLDTYKVKKFQKNNVDFCFLDEFHIEEILKVLNLKTETFKYLNQGNKGVVYEINNNKILKFTEDKGEAIFCNKLLNKTTKHFNTYHLIKKIFWKNSRIITYLLISDKIKILTDFEKKIYDKYNLSGNNNGFGFWHEYFNWGNVESEILPEEEEFLIKLKMQSESIRNEFFKNKFDGIDVSSNNVGFKKNDFILFDPTNKFRNSEDTIDSIFIN